MKICFIGNSHMSRFYSLLTEKKPALEEGAEVPETISPSFFLERAVGTMPLTIYGEGDGDGATFNDILLTRSRPLRCRDYEAFVTIGLGFSLISIIEFWGQYRPLHDIGAGPYSHLVSDAFYQKAAASLLHESKAVRVLREIGKHTNKPRILVPQPYPMLWAQDGQTGRTGVFKFISDSGLLEAAGALYERIVNEIETSGIIVQRQPPETQANVYFTKNEFGLADPQDTSEGSLFSRGDFFHANTAFAELTLASLTKRHLT
jgi:hypothetical protein